MPSLFIKLVKRLSSGFNNIVKSSIIFFKAILYCRSGKAWQWLVTDILRVKLSTKSMTSSFTIAWNQSASISSLRPNHKYRKKAIIVKFTWKIQNYLQNQSHMHMLHMNHSRWYAEGSRTVDLERSDQTASKAKLLAKAKKNHYLNFRFSQKPHTELPGLNSVDVLNRKTQLNAYGRLSIRNLQKKIMQFCFN